MKALTHIPLDQTKIDQFVQTEALIEQRPMLVETVKGIFLTSDYAAPVRFEGVNLDAVANRAVDQWFQSEQSLQDFLSGVRRVAIHHLNLLDQHKVKPGQGLFE